MTAAEYMYSAELLVGQHHCVVMAEAWRWADLPLELVMAAEQAGTLGIEFGKSDDGVNVKLLSNTAGAHEAGLRVNDLIRSINGIRPYSESHAHEIMKRRSIHGDVHKLRIVRPGLGRALLTPIIVTCLLIIAYVAYLYGPSLGGRHEQLEL